MKPAPSVLERETTLPVKKRIEFKIGDPRALMRINAKQYSDVTTAVIREYSTNAYDAHVMAGHRDPIEISLPSVLDPFFEVRDHGVGMNIDTFEEIYTQFGLSDKHDSLETNGQMGIGSKSGLAYTTQFLVTSVRDGIKTEAKVIREPDWTLVMDVLTEDLTDEPNGTVIRIPVHNIDEFCRKAQDFFKFWLPGRVLISGKESVHHVGKKISEGFYYSKDWSTSYVVMANVAYRIANPHALFRNSNIASLNFVAYVDDFKMIDGAQPVEFTPSREDLEYSDRTKATLEAVIHKFEADLVSSAKSEIDSAKTHAEAYSAWAKWKDTLNGNLFGNLTFKGDKFKSDFPLLGRRYSMSGGNNSTIAINSWGVEQAPKTIFVEEFFIEVSSNVKKKVKEWADLTHPDDNFSYIVFTKATSYDSKWVEWDKMVRVTWADVKAALPKASRGKSSYVPGSGRVPGSWDYWTKDAGLSTEEPVPTDKTILYIDTYINKATNVWQVLRLLKSDAVVLVVPGNRLTKLLRENPQIKPFRPWAEAQVIRDGESLLSKDAKKVFKISDDRKRWIDKLDMSLVDDPELKTTKSLLDRKDELLAEYDRHRVLADWLHMRYNGGFKEYAPSSVRGDFYSKYPLLQTVSMYRAIDDDVYVYMNAKHAQTVKETK